MSQLSPFTAGTAISGQLGGAISSSTPSAYTAFNTYYNNAMASYNNVISGYNNLAQQLSGAIAPITQGYTNLYNNVLGTLQGSQQSQLNAVQGTYTANSGQTQQQLIGAGLGNSTVLQSAQLGNVKQEAQAQTQVQNTFANTEAAYESQIGLAGLQWQGQALGMQTQLGEAQLNDMMIPLPNPAGFYNQFAAMKQGGLSNPVGPMGPVPMQGAGTPANQGMGGGDVYGDYGGGGGMVMYGGGNPNPDVSAVGAYGAYAAASAASCANPYTSVAAGGYGAYAAASAASCGGSY